MEENLKNKLGFFTFFFIIIVLLVGGYFLTVYSLNNKNKKEEKKEEVISYKIDEDKEYIYYTNEETISDEAEITYKDVVINLKSQEELTKALQNENEYYKSTIKYITDADLLSNEMINYNNDNLYSLTFRKYKSFEYDKYLSLIIEDYNYSCFDLVTFNKVKSYVFNLSNGNLIEKEELLNLYKIDEDTIKTKVKEYLLSIQKTIDDVELIKIDETIDNLNFNALYINSMGKLEISYLVKTSQVDYNEITEVM